MFSISEIRDAATRLNVGNRAYRDGIHNEFKDRGLLISFATALASSEPIDDEFCEALGLRHDTENEYWYDQASTIICYTDDFTVTLNDGTNMSEIRTKGALLALLWSLTQFGVK